MEHINNDENISFLLEEKYIENSDRGELDKILSEFDNDNFVNPMINTTEYNYNNIDSNDDLNSSYLLDYYNSELYYNEECTVKDLLKICQYYDIDKEIKLSKCKKQDIISTILYFESLSDNFNIVKERNMMWKYINALVNNKKMKKYVIWN